MNHYPHHLGDYAKDTLGFTMMEHGAYRLLLDAYYATEHALAADEVYSIAKAMTPAERKAVGKVLRKFQLVDGHYRHKRVEAELVAYRGRSDSAAESARIRWERERARSANADANASTTHKRTQSGRNAGNGAKAMLASNHKPEPLSTALPGVVDIPAPARGEAVGPEPRVNPDHVARILTECERAKLEDPTEANAIVARWIRNGVTPTQIATALADARRSMPFPYELGADYVDPIVVRIVSTDRKARAAADAKYQATQDTIAEGRDRLETRAPPPVRKPESAAPESE